MIPENEEQLAACVREASGPLVLRGGGTRGIGRPVQGEVLETRGLHGIKLYEPGALTLVAGAGTPLADVEDALAQEGQRLPFEPMDHRGLLGTDGVPTLGGMVAANTSGPRRIQVGACRDSLIGVRFVDGAGEVIKNGGRVMKNVTGYDLAKLLAGSWGTLGILTEVSFKLLPRPETEATLVFEAMDPARGVQAMATALSSPFEVSGAAQLPDGRVLLRLEGFTASVAYRTQQLTRLLRNFGAAQQAEDSASLWRGIRDVAAFHDRPGDVWRVSLKPSDAPALVAKISGETLLDWGGGLIWALTEPGTDLRAQLGSFEGHATLIRASTETRAQIAPFPPEPPANAALARALRQKFDPRGVFNQGLMD